MSVFSSGRKIGEYSRFGGIAVGDLRLLGAEAVRVRWAVVVAGQHVVALLAQAVPVVRAAVRELGLLGRKAGLDDDIDLAAAAGDGSAGGGLRGDEAGSGGEEEDG